MFVWETFSLCKKNKSKAFRKQIATAFLVVASGVRIWKFCNQIGSKIFS